MRHSLAAKICSIFTILTMVITQGVVPGHAANWEHLPEPGSMIHSSTEFTPALLRGLTLNASDPFQFDFIVDPGEENLTDEDLRKEADRLIRYFMASVTVPEEQMWVNLSPYEEDRIVAEGLGQTALGRDLLAQDYILKQLTASLMYPEESLGNEFWQRIYAKAHARFGTTDIPVNTFHKVWIVPEKANVFVQDNTVFVVDNYLKVMLEDDYLALETNQDRTDHGVGAVEPDGGEELSLEAKEVIREVLIPEIEREVNQGKNFAMLRQIFNSMILATWYKQNLRQSIFARTYANQNATSGIDLQDKEVKDKIYQMYVDAFEQGVYSYIKEEYDVTSQEYVPRKYFSGGIRGTTNVGARDDVTRSQVITGDESVVRVQIRGVNRRTDRAVLGDPNSILDPSSNLPVREFPRGELLRLRRVTQDQLTIPTSVPGFAVGVRAGQSSVAFGDGLNKYLIRTVAFNPTTEGYSQEIAQGLADLLQTDDLRSKTLIYLGDILPQFFLAHAHGVTSPQMYSDVEGALDSLDPSVAQILREIIQGTRHAFGRSNRLEQLRRDLAQNEYLRGENIFSELSADVRYSALDGAKKEVVTVRSFDILRTEVDVEGELDSRGNPGQIIVLGEQIDALDDSTGFSGYAPVGNTEGYVFTTRERESIYQTILPLLTGASFEVQPFREAHSVNEQLRALLLKDSPANPNAEQIETILDNVYNILAVHERQHNRDEVNGFARRLISSRKQIALESSAYLASMAQTSTPFTAFFDVVANYLMYQANGQRTEDDYVYAAAYANIINIVGQRLGLEDFEVQTGTDALSDVNTLLDRLLQLSSEEFRGLAEEIHTDSDVRARLSSGNFYANVYRTGEASDERRQEIRSGVIRIAVASILLLGVVGYAANDSLATIVQSAFDSRFLDFGVEAPESSRTPSFQQGPTDRAVLGSNRLGMDRRAFLRTLALTPFITAFPARAATETILLLGREFEVTLFESNLDTSRADINVFFGSHLTNYRGLRSEDHFQSSIPRLEEVFERAGRYNRRVVVFFEDAVVTDRTDFNAVFPQFDADEVLSNPAVQSRFREAYRAEVERKALGLGTVDFADLHRRGSSVSPQFQYLAQKAFIDGFDISLRYEAPPANVIINNLRQRATAAERLARDQKLAQDILVDIGSDANVSVAVFRGMGHTDLFDILQQRGGQVFTNIATTELQEHVDTLRSQTGADLAVLASVSLAALGVFAAGAGFFYVRNQLQRQPLADLAEVDEFTKGGIDLNAANLNLQVSGDTFNYQPIVDATPIQVIYGSGYTPIIIDIIPITNLPLLLGERRPETPDQLSFRK